jgi:serine/threonine-protein kinase RsbW
MDEMNSYQVQTATIEAVNNAIIHAYQGQEGHEVVVNWTLEKGSINIEVLDQGKSMEKMPPEIQPSPEAESGRGWWIMRRWMDHTDYESYDDFNRVIMVRKI